MKNFKNFNSTQRELFAICNAGWESCREYLDRFKGFRPLYSDDYLHARQEEIITVSEMPDRSRRSYKKDIKRIQLTEKLAECLDEWKKLKLGITGLWPSNQHDAHFKGIGQGLYQESVRRKWEACTGLMDQALAFISDHSEMIAGSNLLGPQFAGNFKTLTDSFKSLLKEYVARLNEDSEVADAKLQACNKLYKDLMFMFADARIIFKNDPVKLKRFTFETQLDVVSGQNSAGIRGRISAGTVAVSDIPELSLVLVGTEDEPFIDSDGSYRFSQMSAGSYTLVITAPGYKEQRFQDIMVNTGSYTIQNIMLEKETADEK